MWNPIFWWAIQVSKAMTILGYIWLYIFFHYHFLCRVLCCIVWVLHLASPAINFHSQHVTYDSSSSTLYCIFHFFLFSLHVFTSSCLGAFIADPVITVARVFVTLLVAFSYPLQCHPARCCLMTFWSSVSSKDQEITPETYTFRYVVITVSQYMWAACMYVRMYGLLIICFKTKLLITL